ncbi:MAG: TlpA disulfide reductase family protein [Bacteriovoracaceae bacterium]
MKYLSYFVLLFLVFSFASAQSLVTIQSSSPKSGERITVAYDPRSAGAVHTNATTLYAVAVFWHIEERSTMLEQKMERSGDQWMTSFVIEDPKAVSFSLRFESEDSIDNNQGAGWTILLSGKNGKPVKGAQFMQAIMRLQKDFMGFIRQQDTLMAISLLRAELAAYPDQWSARTLLWSIEMKQSPGEKTKKRIAKELDAIYTKQKNNEEAVRTLLSAFRLTDQSKKAETIEATWLKKNPTGVIAEMKALQKFRDEHDQTKRAALAAQVVEQFPVKPGMEQMFLSAFLRVKEYQQAVTFIGKYPDVSPNFYNSIGYGLINEGEQIALGVSIAKQGLDRIPAGDVRTTVDLLGQNRSSWKENNQYLRGMIGDSYGEGLMKLGKYSEAESALEESHTMMQGDDPDNNARLAECYVKNNKHAKAVTLSYSSLVKGKGSPQLIEQYKTAYSTVNGSIAGFDSVMNAANIEMRNELRAKLKKEIVEKPSVDFELKSIDGSIVKLSELKGKVVVLDFWATWCGPCLASFPSLQKIYDRYKDNPDVMILTMNTWERVPPTEREQHVKTFMEKNKYTFPVLFDTDLVFQYGVDGIPTKFILDKNGMIRFKDIGFGGGEEMEVKMELQFEMLLGAAVSTK